MQLRATIKKLPFAMSVYTLLRLARGRNARFEADYSENSGAGSDLRTTSAVVEQLPGVVQRISARSMLDIPCGDFLWMQRVDLDGVAYIGGDVIETLIASHQKKYASPARRFMTLDLVTSDLPEVDLIFCRDCLVHFSHRLVRKAVNNIKRSRSRYLLTTTFPTRSRNAGIVTGNWQPLNLCAAPFNFPPPIELISEGNTAPHEDKSLGLWRIEDLPTL